LPDVKQTFTADISDLERKMATLQANYLKLKETLAQVRSESKKGADEFTKWGNAQLGTIKSMALGYASVGAAVGLVTSAMGQWREKMDAAADKSKNMVTTLVEGLEKAGALMKLGAAGDWVEKIVKTKTATEPQAIAAFLGAGAGAPGTGTATQQAIAQQALRSARSLGPEAIGSRAELIGRITSLLEKTPEQAGGLAAVMTSVEGDDAKEMLSRGFLGGVRALAKSGAATPEEAIAIGMTAIQEKMSPRIIESLAAKVASGGKAPHIARGHRPTEEQRAEIEFARMTPAERLQTLLANPDRMGAEGVTGLDKLGRISPSGVALNLQRLQIGERSGAPSDATALAAGGQRGQIALTEHALQIEESLANLAKRNRALELEHANRGLAASQAVAGVGPFESYARQRAQMAGQFAHAALPEVAQGSRSLAMDLASRGDSNLGGGMAAVAVLTQILNVLWGQRGGANAQSATNAAMNARTNGNEN